MDFDGDGIKDIISGSWPGEIFFFKGRGHGQFDDRVKVKDKNGKTMNIGGGIQRNDDREFLIAGDATFETKDGKQYIVYEGERTECKPDREYGITGTASAVYAIDLDRDGDLDLVVGDMRGNVWYVINEGSAGKWSFGKERALVAGGAKVKTTGDAGPAFGDFDGDGRPDLLLGSGDGSVTLYRNSGEINEKTKLPIFEKGSTLVPSIQQGIQGALPGVQRGMRTKVCLADWNGDGKPDLIVGDFTMQKPEPPKLSPDQKAEQDAISKQVTELQPRYDQLMQKLFNNDGKKLSADERKKVNDEFGEVNKKMQALRSKLPSEYEEHGWVWLYLHK